MHLEIESTVIAAANPEGQVSFFRLLPHLPTFWNNRPRSGFETDQHLILIYLFKEFLSPLMVLMNPGSNPKVWSTSSLA